MPEVKYGSGSSEHGPGVRVSLTRDEVAWAIDAYLMVHRVVISGSQTLYSDGSVYVDPSGFVICDGVKYSGRGPE